MNIKYILRIFIYCFLIFTPILLIINERIVIEKMTNNISMSGSKAFCDVNKGFALEKACNKLTKYNCGLTSCCVYTSENKCKAGNASGPTFNSDANGKTKQIDYYFQNKFYT
jgi:hypothetical protein